MGGREREGRREEKGRERGECGGEKAEGRKGIGRRERRGIERGKKRRKGEGRKGKEKGKSLNMGNETRKQGRGCESLPHLAHMCFLVTREEPTMLGRWIQYVTVLGTCGWVSK